MKKDITIFGAGLAGLTAAINLTREGYKVTVFEKEKQIGGLANSKPSVHMTPINFKKMKDYIGIDVEPCFSELATFKAYLYSKTVRFNPRHLYQTERGPNKTSLDHYLYKIALEEEVDFNFSHPLTPEIIHSLPDNSIIATGSYSSLCKLLNLRYSNFIHFDGHNTITNDNNFCVAYFDTYFGGYNYAYVAGKNGLVSSEVDFNISQPYEELLEKFKQQLKETENIEISNWSLVADVIPEEIKLLTKINGKTVVLAGAMSGYFDPFFGFGVNSALISGKIASIALVSRDRGMQEFKQFTSNLNRYLLFSKINKFLPMRNIVIPWLFRNTTIGFPLIRRSLRSIPGFIDDDCFEILNK